MIYITGDTHGDMSRIVRFCERMETSKEDIMIILGDVGLNYYGDSRDRRNKEKVANLPIMLFCIHALQLPPITPHICRHIFCSNIARQGMNGALFLD